MGDAGGTPERETRERVEWGYTHLWTAHSGAQSGRDARSVGDCHSECDHGYRRRGRVGRHLSRRACSPIDAIQAVRVLYAVLFFIYKVDVRYVF